MAVRSATPYLAVRGADAALAFYARAFGAQERERWTAPDGRIGHATFTIDGITFYLADEHPELGVVAPRAGERAVSFVLEVDDARTAWERAVAAGATVERPLAEAAYAVLAGWLWDPFGHHWGIQQPHPEGTAPDLQTVVGDSYTITKQEA